MQVLDTLEQHCDCDDEVWNDDKQLKTKFKTFVFSLILGIIMKWNMINEF